LPFTPHVIASWRQDTMDGMGAASMLASMAMRASDAMLASNAMLASDATLASMATAPGGSQID
jgi:hypothetical protein